MEPLLNSLFEATTIAQSDVKAGSVNRCVCDVQNYSMFLEHLTTELKEVFIIY